MAQLIEPHWIENLAAPSEGSMLAVLTCFLPNIYSPVPLIHEFGHEYSEDHLSSEYHDALCKLGTKMAQLALDEPKCFIVDGNMQ